MPDCQSTRKMFVDGKEDSVKETQEGCLSRWIKTNFELFEVQNLPQLVEKAFSTSCSNAMARYAALQKKKGGVAKCNAPEKFAGTAAA